MFLVLWLIFAVALMIYMHASTEIPDAELLNYRVGSVIVAGLAALLANAARKAVRNARRPIA